MSTEEIRVQLIEIIEQNLLEISSSAFCSAVGGSKSFYQRLKSGESQDKSILQRWNCMKAYYQLDDETISDFINSFHTAKDLRKRIEKLIVSKQKSETSRNVTTLFTSLLFDDKNNTPKGLLSEDDFNRLIQLRYNDALLFSEILAILLLLVMKKDIASVSLKDATKAGIKELLTIINGKDEGKINTDVQEAAANYMAEVKVMDNIKVGLYQKTVRLKMFIYAYLCPDFRRAIADMYYLLPVERLSFWVDTATLNSNSPDLYALTNMYTDNMPDGGVYIIHQLDLTGSVNIRKCQYLAMIDEGSDNGFAYSCTMYRKEEKELEYYDYAYDNASETLHLKKREKGETTDNVQLFPLPKHLHLINEKCPKNKTDSDILHKYLFGKQKLIDDKIVEKLMKSDGISMAKGISVEDVCISRKYLELVLKENGAINKYRVNLSNHSSLCNITPDRFLFISRHENDGKLYAEWAEPHYAVCMDEFTKIEE